jgi:hypothetical protein
MSHPRVPCFIFRMAALEGAAGRRAAYSGCF